MELIPAGTWLSSIHPSLAGYEKAFIEYGYEDTQMLSAATPEDLANDFNEMGMKKKPSQAYFEGFERTQQRLFHLFRLANVRAFGAQDPRYRYTRIEIRCQD